MHAGRQYTFREVSVWTRRETAVFVAVSALPALLYFGAGWRWLVIPWLPIAMIGTAVAFITGFKNNASYSRLWEARQIWGAIVNASRSFALLTLDSIPDPAHQRRLLYRHFAWLTALRYQLREPRSWENMKRRHNTEYARKYRVAEWDGQLQQNLAPLLTSGDLALLSSCKNRATQLLRLQSQDLHALLQSESSPLRALEFHRQLGALIDAQGRCERIKNFPYPRQYATLNYFFIWLFIILTPFGLIQEFQKLGDNFVWLTIPAGTIVAWVFHTMDKIGESSENPFEGSPNDVPITAMSRTIEIDLREMLGEAEIPPPLTAENHILM